MSTPTETAPATTEATKPTETKPEPMDADPKPEATEKKVEPEAEKPAEAKSEEKAEEKAKDKEAGPVKKPETFFVETKNSPRKAVEGVKNDIKKKAINLRPQLMKFPGAVRIHCAKASKDGEYAIVVRVEKPEKDAEIKLPEEFGELMKLDKTIEGKKDEGFFGEYELNDKSGRIQIKLFEAGKIESLDAPKTNPGRLKDSKPTTKFLSEEEIKKLEEEDPLPKLSAKEEKKTEEKVEEAKPAETKESSEPKPAEAKSAEKAMETEETAEKPEKRPREETTEDAPAAKRAKVAEEEKPTDAAAAAAVC